MVAEPAKVLAPAGRSCARWWLYVMTTWFLVMATSTDCRNDDFLYDQEHVNFMDYMDENAHPYEKKDYERDGYPQLSRWPDLHFMKTNGLTESLGDYWRWMGTTSFGWIGATRWQVKSWIGTMLDDDGSHDPSDYILKKDNKSLAEVEDWHLDLQQCFRFEDEDWHLVQRQVEDWNLNLKQLHSQSLQDYEYSFNYSTGFVMAMDYTKAGERLA
eukprot:g25602.t1